ncbi:Cerevisin [Dactylellina cionopaga]|nr:Cerevisin [Dactylellina cionopaga]
MLFNVAPGDIEDPTGHGTHVAGIMGSVHFGVAKNVTIWGINIYAKVQGAETITNAVAGIKAALNQHNQRKQEEGFKGSIMNLSWGFADDIVAGDGSAPLKEVIKSATEAGMHITIAAGNKDKDACTQLPAGYVKDFPSLIIVGSSDIRDTREPKSNFGRCVDLHAPGVDITSTVLVGGKRAVSGTSVAAPLVAGVIATEIVKNPDLRDDPLKMKKHILSKALKNIVKDADNGGNLLLFTGMSGNPLESFT